MMPNLIAQYGNLTVGLAWTAAFLGIVLIARVAGLLKFTKQAA